MNEIKQVLEDLNLNEKQVGVYLSLLKLGESTAYQVSKESSIKRSTVYVVLDELFDLGLILKIPNVKKQVYLAKDLDEYIFDKQKKLNEAKRILPTLKKLRRSSRPNILHFEGFEGIKEAIYYNIDQGNPSEMCSFYASLEGHKSKYLPMFYKWNLDMIKNGYKFKLILPSKVNDDDFELLEDINFKKAHRNGIFDLKHIDYNFPNDTSFEIGNDFIRIMSVESEKATIIQDENTAKAFREIFNIIWNK